MNNFREKYTTTKLIAEDKTGLEEVKTIISNDTYALGETLAAVGDLILDVKDKLEQLRLSSIR